MGLGIPARTRKPIVRGCFTNRRRSRTQKDFQKKYGSTSFATEISIIAWKRDREQWPLQSTLPELGVNDCENEKRCDRELGRV